MTAMIGMIILDSFGRRSVSFWGCILQTIFLCLIGGLGDRQNRSTSDTNGMVASFILYAAILHMSLGPAAYITSAEVGTSTLREKTMAIAVRILDRTGEHFTDSPNRLPSTSSLASWSFSLRLTC